MMVGPGNWAGWGRVQCMIKRLPSIQAVYASRELDCVVALGGREREREREQGRKRGWGFLRAS